MSSYQQHPHHMVQMPANIDLHTINKQNEPKKPFDLVGILIILTITIVVFVCICFMIWYCVPNFGAI